MVEESKVLRYLLIVMKNLNFIILIFISALIAYSLSGIIHENSGLAFLEKIDALPIAPWKIILIVFCLYLSCLCLMSLEIQNPVQISIKLICELILIFLVCYFINFSYLGLFLLFIAELLDYFPKFKWKIISSIVFCIIYILIEFLVLTISTRLISFDIYLNYFQQDTRLLILGLKDVLTCINLLLFLFYVVFSLRLSYDEKVRILNLNKQLNQTNEELKLTNEELLTAKKQIEQNSAELVKMAETRERNRLAREIHDTLGHSLTGIITGLEACVKLVDIAPEATKIQLKSIIEVATQGMTDVRRSVNRLRPDSLDKFDLKKAIVKSIDEISSATKAEINYQFLTDFTGLSNDEEDIIYRIIQESITNSIRHGRATKINVLTRRKDNLIEIQVSDNGIGCKKVHKGFGLHHMEERLRMLNGQLSYNGENGFIIKAKIPIRNLPMLQEIKEVKNDKGYNS